MMDKKQLKKYKSNKRRIAGIKKTIDKLVEQLDNVPVYPWVKSNMSSSQFIASRLLTFTEPPKNSRASSAPSAT